MNCLRLPSSARSGARRFPASMLFASASSLALVLSCAAPRSDTSSTADSLTSEWGASCATDATDITPTIRSGSSFHGAATHAASLALSTCGNRTARSQLLRYDLPEYGNYRVDIRSALPPSDPRASDAAVVVRSDCTKFIGEIACNAEAANKSTFIGYHLSGPVYIRIEGEYFAQGFDLTITKLAACAHDSDCTDWPDGRCNQFNGNCISDLKCRGSLGNCDYNWDNGCETDLSTNAANCGACNSKCDATAAHTSAATCSAGVCQLTCESGFGNCDGFGGTGCESNLENEGLSCGSCGTSCGGGVCSGGACVSYAEELAQIPGIVPISSGGSNWNYGLDKIQLSKGRVVVKDEQYIPHVWSIPRAGGTPVDIGSGMDFGASPSSADVWTFDISFAQRVPEAGGSAGVRTTLGNFEEARQGGFDGTTAYLLEEVVASTPTTPASVRSLTPGASSSTLLWSAPSSGGHFAEPVITPTKVIVRPIGWSGYAYNDYFAQLTVIDKATGATSQLGPLPRMLVPLAADDAGVYWGADGVYFLAYGGTSPQKLWSGGWVSAIAVDATTVYFSGGDDCSWDGTRKARIYALPRSGGAAREVGFDRVGPPVGTFDARCDNWIGELLAVDSGYVYWVATDRIRRIAK